MSSASPVPWFQNSCINRKSWWKEKFKKRWCGQLLGEVWFGLVWNRLTLAILHYFFYPCFLPFTPKCSRDFIGIYLVFWSKHNLKNHSHKHRHSQNLSSIAPLESIKTEDRWNVQTTEGRKRSPFSETDSPCSSDSLCIPFQSRTWGCET